MSKKSKTTPFMARPEPPSVKHVIEDITNASDDDIVFSLLQSEAGT